MKWFHWLAISLLLIGTAVDQVTTIAGFNFANEINSYVVHLIKLGAVINVFQFGELARNIAPFGIWTFIDAVILVSIIIPYLYLHERRYFAIVFFSFCSTLGLYRLYAGAVNLSLMVKDVGAF